MAMWFTWRLRLIVGLSILLSVGCGTRQPALEIDDVRPDQVVVITREDGQRVSGVVTRASETAIALRPQNAPESLAIIQKSDIRRLTGPQPIFDDHGHPITEQEIKRATRRDNLTTHTILGGLVSLGASVFTSVLLTNELDLNPTTVYATAGTIVGTTAGTLLFARAGARKDREAAIERIVSERHPEAPLPEDATDKLIMQRIELLKRQREEHRKEIERLKQDIREMEQQLLPNE